MFKNIDNGKTTYFEMTPETSFNMDAVKDILRKFTIVTFNGRNYDAPIMFMALTGNYTNSDLKDASDEIIVTGRKFWHIEMKYGFKIPLNLDHIDIMEVAPGKGSLKLYGGRLHSRKLQDLPIDPAALIMPDQYELMRSYCGNDLNTTIDLFNALRPQIDLCEKMSL